MSQRPSQLEGLDRDIRQAGAVIAGSLRSGSRDDAQAREEAVKADMIRDLDQQLAELNRQIDAHRALAGHGASDPHLSALEQRSAQLLSVRQNVESASNLAHLSQLRGQVTEAVRGAGETVQAATAFIGAGGAIGSVGFTARQMAEANYSATMQRIERDMQPIMQRVDRMRGEDDRLGARYGVDTDRFNRVDDELRERGETARRNGDRHGGIEADTLRGWNALYRGRAILDGMPPGAERDQREAQQRRQEEDVRRQEQLRQQSQAEGVERDARRQEAQTPFADAEERRNWIRQRTQERETRYQEERRQRAAAAGVTPDQQRAVDTGVGGGAPSQTPGVRTGTPQPPVPTVNQPSPPAMRQLTSSLDDGMAEPPAAPFQHQQTAELPAAARDAARAAAAPAAQSGTRTEEQGGTTAPQAPSSTPNQTAAAQQGSTGRSTA